MNQIIKTAISFFFLTLGIQVQSVSAQDRCISMGFKDVDLFIPGSIDTVQQNGMKVKAIHASDLVNGFELVSTDSLVKIERFQLVFDNRIDGNIYIYPSKGSTITPSNTMLFPLSKVKDAGLITVENIFIRYNGVCYRARSQVYLTR